MRRNIKLEYRHEKDEVVQPIYFYTHHGAETLAYDLQNALKRGEDRWDDESYLARIIFSEMIQHEVLDRTGYGIAPYECDPQFPTIVVNLQEQTVDGIPFSKFILMDVSNYEMY